MSDLIILKEFLTRHDAGMVKSLLEENGIKCLVQADDVGGIRPELAFGSAVKLKVTAEDLEEAKKILSAFENTE